MHKGYVERAVSDRDRRARTLRLTETGRTLLDAVRPLVRGAQDSILAGLDSEERRTFIALLRKVTDGANGRSRAPLRATLIDAG